MKVLLTAVNSKFVHSNLAVRYLKSYTKDLDYDCEIKEFSINDREENIIATIMEVNPDIVAFSTYIWNIEMIGRLSNIIKIINKDIEIVYGGPEVSYDSMNILKGLAGDIIIEGEGEKTYREYIEYKLGIRNVDSIRGLYYKEDGSPV